MGCKVVHGEVGVTSRERFEVVVINREVEAWLRSIRAVDGILTVYVPHTTAAIAVNEAESGLMQDILDILKETTKPGWGWKHNRIDNNAHAHLGNILVGPSVVIPVKSGAMRLGTWQSIMFIEMDGPRRRRVLLTFTGEVEE
ncbi:MAG: secondary thiamine-phosphate synthase enzyme YjbQ [Desulfurococcales archaeon]|nr:secondary thiamine-phosphate synthase enzyme YjbQ [Desulfurococcales archaeon]